MNKIELYLGDCLEKMKLLEDNSIDCIITSPPYNKGFFNTVKKSNQIWGKFQINYNTFDDNMEIETYEKWMIQILNEMKRIVKCDGSIFFNHKPIRYKNKVYHPLNFILKSDLLLYQEIIWNRFNSPNIRNDILTPCTERIYWLCKNKPKVFRNNLSNLFCTEIWNITAKKQTTHPAPFPLELPVNCILLSTQKETWF